MMLQFTDVGDLNDDTLACWNVAKLCAENVGGLWRLLEESGSLALGDCGIKDLLGFYFFLTTC